ncbi:RICIN domain-containing protein [Actinoplanes sp. NPDC051859]|uniref:RICIN domain-containing protein n=1 Tax=Actinoplanes sp. NPDC051859 TaxID=3363909 RepID=UPI00378D6BD8
MPAHRRPATPGEAPTRRRSAPGRGRRKGPTTSRRLLLVLLGVTLLGVGGVVVPTLFSADDNRDPLTYTSLPATDPSRGMVYVGLVPARPDALCAGTFEIDDETCTHGPDPAPTWLTVARDVNPVTGKWVEPQQPQRETAAVPQDADIVRDEGGNSLTAGAPALIPDAAPGQADFIMGTHGVACDGDGRSGNRIQPLYLHEFGTPSRFAEYLDSLRAWAAGADGIFDASAAETGGSRHLRYVTTPQCQVDVAEVQLPAGGLTTFPQTIAELQKLGYNRNDRKYLIFADTNVYCGIGTYIADNRPGLGNRNNGGPSYGRVDSGCWSSTVAAVETTHMLGALLRDSPNSTGVGSCTDGHDPLCYPDRSGKAMRTVCPERPEIRLDCGHDDYFSTDPKPNSYLAKNWNVAQSEFLLRSDGGDEPTGAPDAATKAPATPAATTAPETPQSRVSAAVTETPATGGDESDGGGDAPVAQVPVSAPIIRTANQAAARAVQAVLEVREPSSTSVRLTWSAAAPQAQYDVEVDGKKVATTGATRARLIGLRPDTKYEVTIRSTAGYAAKAVAQSAPAARPAANTWFVLRNSLTGGAADLYAARTADGTPVTLGGADGGSQQQWKLIPAGTDTYSLQSRATNKCVVPLGGNPVAGAPLVQGDCAGPGRWKLFAADYGFSLRTIAGDLTAGVGAQRFGAARLLVLQPPEQARHQSWTAVPG